MLIKISYIFAKGSIIKIKSTLILTLLYLIICITLVVSYLEYLINFWLKLTIIKYLYNIFSYTPIFCKLDK